MGKRLEVKLYVLDEVGSVIFEFSEQDGGMRLAASQEARVKATSLVKAALEFLQTQQE